MAKAIWNEKVIAESNSTIVVEGNQYFPPDSVKSEYLNSNQDHTVCPWKGVASYYDLSVDGKTLKSAAWYYPEPKEAAKGIKNYVAFWKGVNVVS